LKKYLWIGRMAITLAVAASGGAVFAAASPIPTSGEFDQIQTIVTPRLTIKSVDHVTFKGIRYKMDSVDPQSFDPFQDIDDGQSYYHFVPAATSAARIVFKGKQPGALDELKAETDSKLQGMTKSGNAEVSGYSCNIYTKDLGGGASVTMYLSTDAQFPYIVKTTLKVPGKDLVQTNEIDNIKLGSLVDDATFLLPKGTKIIDQPPAQPAATPQGGQTPATNGVAAPVPSGP
jgi:hypothetical protein